MKRLSNLTKNNQSKDWINKDIYRLMFDRNLYMIAYNKIKSKPGNMTPGTQTRTQKNIGRKQEKDKTEEDANYEIASGTTLDGMSEEVIDTIIKELKDERFQFKPVRRVDIPKPNGKTRPLGVPSPRDKLVQEVMRMLLEAIFEPRFSIQSHGFRPNRGTHTCLKEVRNWQSIDWFIEADIKGCFDNIDHQILATILSKKIQDQRFLSLYWKAARAGYVLMDESTIHQTLSGVPQGTIISPILSNIYLTELDREIESIKEAYKEKLEQPQRKGNKEYKRIQMQMIRLNKAGKSKEAFQKRKHLQSLPSKEKKDKNYLRINYVRYADDFLLGIIGPKSLAIEIYERITKKLAELNLEMNKEKSGILRGYEETKFLGTKISMWNQTSKQTASKAPKNLTQLSENQSQQDKRVGNYIKMKAPIDTLVEKLYKDSFCDHLGDPLAKVAWVNLDPRETIHRYNSILWGILNYYSFVDNYTALQRIQFILQHSLAKTLCNKLRISTRRQLFEKYGANITWTTEVNKVKKTTELKLNHNWKIDRRRFMDNPSDKIFRENYYKITGFGKGSACAICGCTESVEMHHVRHIRKVNQKLTGFTRQMALINRKQVPVCRPCHIKIHQGKLDDFNLKEIGKNFTPVIEKRSTSGGELAGISALGVMPRHKAKLQNK